MRVLLAEDEKKVAGFIRKALREASYAVDGVHDGEAALALAIETPYDAIILDIMMPRRDGLSVLKLLRARLVQTPVLILTARGEVSERILISIGNTGCGIPVERSPQLFDRFFRSNPRPETSGCGLGLSLARELARAHRGDVELVSSEPDWTVFVLQLPAPRSQQQHVPESYEAAVG